MRIESIELSPFHELQFLEVGQDGRVQHSMLPFLRGTVDALPDGCHAVVASSDLQGRVEQAGGELTRPLADAVAEELKLLSECQVLPPLEEAGVLLAGDYFCDPTLSRRGGLGDVRDAWLAFARVCRSVVGVAGNHDLLGPQIACPGFEAFRQLPGIHFLDGDLVDFDGLRVAGISGVIGNPRRSFRRTEADFQNVMGLLLRQVPELLILHEAPAIPELKLKGHPAVRAVLDQVRASRCLVLCGHAHWDIPLTTTPGGFQVLNVDRRVVVLEAAQVSQPQQRSVA